jgi:hypothetical protein
MWGEVEMGLQAVHDIIVYCKGYEVAQLVGALLHKPGSRGFDSRMSYWDFLTEFLNSMALGSTQPLTEMSTRSIS